MEGALKSFGRGCGEEDKKRGKRVVVLICLSRRNYYIAWRQVACDLIIHVKSKNLKAKSNLEESIYLEQ